MANGENMTLSSIFEKVSIRDWITWGLLVALFIAQSYFHIRNDSIHLAFEEKAAVKQLAEKGPSFSTGDRILLSQLKADMDRRERIIERLEAAVKELELKTK